MQSRVKNIYLKKGGGVHIQYIYFLSELVRFPNRLLESAPFHF